MLTIHYCSQAFSELLYWLLKSYFELHLWRWRSDEVYIAAQCWTDVGHLGMTVSWIKWTTSEWCIWQPFENLKCTVCHLWSLISSSVTSIHKILSWPSLPLYPPHLLSCQACASPDWFIKTYAHIYQPERDILGSQ